MFCKLWVRTPPGSEIFSLSPCGPINFLSRANAQKVNVCTVFGYLLEEHFNLSHLNLYSHIHIGLILIITKLEKLSGSS